MELDYWNPNTEPTTTKSTPNKSLTKSNRSCQPQTRTLHWVQHPTSSSSKPLDTKTLLQEEKKGKEEETVQLKDNPESSTPTSLSTYSSCEALSLCTLTDNGNLYHLLQKQLDKVESSEASRNKTHGDHHRPQPCSSASQDKEKPALEEQCSTAQVVSPTVEATTTTTTLLFHHQGSPDNDYDNAFNSLNEQDQKDSWNHVESVSPPPATSADPMVQSCCLSSPPPPSISTHNEGSIPDNSEVQESATHGPSPVDEVDIELPPSGETNTAASNNVVGTAATLEAVGSTPLESSANPRSPCSSVKCSSSNVSFVENKLGTTRESPSLPEEILVATPATNCAPQSSKQVDALYQNGRTVTTVPQDDDDDELLLDESFQLPQQEDGLVGQEEDNEQRASSPQQESSASQENQKDDECVSSNATRQRGECARSTTKRANHKEARRGGRPERTRRCISREQQHPETNRRVLSWDGTHTQSSRTGRRGREQLRGTVICFDAKVQPRHGHGCALRYCIGTR